MCFNDIFLRWHRIGISVSYGRLTSYINCELGDKESFKRSTDPVKNFDTEGMILIGQDFNDSPKFQVRSLIHQNIILFLPNIAFLKDESKMTKELGFILFVCFVLFLFINFFLSVYS